MEKSTKVGGQCLIYDDSDSLRKALVRKVREMGVAVNWLNFELVVGKGC